MKLKHMILVPFVIGLASSAFAAGDADKGKKLFKKCASCHMVGEKAKNKVGPILNGIVGAQAGQAADFKYSKAMVAMVEDGLIWNEASLAAFLASPRKFMKGTKMSFNGLRKESEQADVIAYLATFK